MSYIQKLNKIDFEIIKNYVFYYIHAHKYVQYSSLIFDLITDFFGVVLRNQAQFTEVKKHYLAKIRVYLKELSECGYLSVYSRKKTKLSHRFDFGIDLAIEIITCFFIKYHKDGFLKFDFKQMRCNETKTIELARKIIKLRLKRGFRVEEKKDLQRVVSRIPGRMFGEVVAQI